jgi:lactoylglutathione lyase
MLHGPTPEPAQYGTRNHVSLEVADCAKAAAILKVRPGSRDFRMDDVKVGVNRKRQVNIYDADGSRVELMEPVTVDGKPAPASSALPPIR